MEFNEKLQNLRKSKGLTQEELALHLYVSRTAVSKWESGRGYPSIDSIKEIASFFDVTVDELLSSEKILSIAKKENKQNIQKMCNLLFGVVDLFSLMLVVLPLYPNNINGRIFSVSLINYTDTTAFNLTLYWVMFVLLIAVGAVKIILTQANVTKGQKAVTWCSLCLSVFTILLLSITRQAYATVVVFMLLIIKAMLYIKHSKT